MIKKLIPLFLALAAIFCVMPMRGDTPPGKQKDIPLDYVLTQPTVRSLIPCDLHACYCYLSESIQTIASSHLGSVEISVINLTTGETWSDIFDSAVTPHFLPISGAPGLYEITYLTSFGDLYEGTFTIE